MSQTTTDEPDEILDLVNDQDEVIGTILRGETPNLLKTGEGFVRASNCFILNSQGQIWVPTRATHKGIAPGGLDFSVSEHVKSGETYEQGLLRGFQEEVGFTPKPEQLEYVGKLHLPPVGVPYFVQLYLYRSNGVPDYNKDDFTSYQWMTPEALLDKLENGAIAKLDMSLAAKLLITHLKTKGQ